MTNGVSGSVITAPLVGPDAPMRLKARCFPTYMWDFRMDFPNAITPARVSDSDKRSDREKLHANANDNNNYNSFGGLKKLYNFWRYC